MSTAQVVIIGAGPAGISCAIWLHKLGVNCVLLEAAEQAGGLQTVSPYENLWVPGVQGRTGQDIARALQDHVEALGIDLRLARRVEAVEPGWKVATADGVIEASFVVLATGTQPRAGDFRPSPTVAIGPGTPVEAMEVAGRSVAVLGGGDNAFDQARFLVERGARPTVFSRTPPRAQKLLQDLIPQVPVIAGPYAASQDAMTINGAPFDLFAVMYGFEAVLPPGIEPRLDNGYVAVDRFGATSLPGLFACGEVTDYWHPCVTTAAAHGIQVAKQISLRV